MTVHRFVVLLVTSFVEISLLRLVRICLADNPVSLDKMLTLVTNEPLGIICPCHFLSS